MAADELEEGHDLWMVPSATTSVECCSAKPRASVPCQRSRLRQVLALMSQSWRAFQPDGEWDILAGDADTEDEGETVGQADGEPQAPEEAPAAHQVAAVVDSGEAPSEIVAPAPSIETACPGPVRAPDNAIMRRFVALRIIYGREPHIDGWGAAVRVNWIDCRSRPKTKNPLLIDAQNQKIHLLIDTKSLKPTYRVEVWE